MRSDQLPPDAGLTTDLPGHEYSLPAPTIPNIPASAVGYLHDDGGGVRVWRLTTSSDVTTALGFTPYNAANPSGFITGITGLMVTTALGFTPIKKAGDTGIGDLSMSGLTVDSNDSYFGNIASGAFADIGSLGTSNVYIDARSNSLANVGLILRGKGTGGIGFQGATPIAKPTITGSRGGNAALASLLTNLASYGLITDSSTI